MMMPSESIRPPSSTEFTTSAAASLRTELRTDPDEFAMPGEGLQPLSNNIVTKVGEDPHGDLHEKGSSIWCTGTNHTNRLCHFRNLCYLSTFDDFVFFHSEHSTIYGVPENRFKPALLDLSTIEDHNTQYFNYVDLPISALEKFDVTVSKITTLMFNRFYNENIMHVLHDDLIPAFHTLLMIANGDTDAVKNIQLLLSDDLSDGDFFKLYQTLSNHEIFSRKSLREQQRNICFQDIYVGLSTATLWYQYGYHKPQGPLSNYKSSLSTIRKFTSFMKDNLKSRRQGFMGHFMGDYFVLLSRKENRKIINEGDLIMGIANRFKIQVRTLSLEENKVSEIIEVLRSARGAIGMHGSLLSLAMFLPPGSVFVELFPYAVNPWNYTPYKTMAKIPGIDLVYRFWRNKNKTRTYIHPDNVPEYGGIKHLQKDVQEKILQDIDVPPHFCCKDPHWLFRAYQDTRVNIKTVLKLIESGKNESEKYMKAKKSVIHVTGLHAGKVQSLLCKPVINEGTLSLVVSWDMPWNLHYFENVDLKVKFEVWIQEVGEEKYKAWIVEGRKHTLGLSELNPGVKHLIWVRAIIEEKVGPFNDAFICDL
ncbi:protein O-linked-mannose beta-1,4-N-acetylglucosaminyltransferase 2-like [Lineus longissimus]|uniref:protein O-linked-mannose beta-1,4-N-acetylglucosaminyltransferase 2-like n=1 Tax=Lineus longissimus TaxID=88925 RepID=UPI00315D48E4